MSLRGFHLIFISIAALFCAGFGVWALVIEERAGLGLQLAGGFTSAVAVALVFYAFSFSRKAKHLVE